MILYAIPSFRSINIMSCGKYTGGRKDSHYRTGKYAALRMQLTRYSRQISSVVSKTIRARKNLTLIAYFLMRGEIVSVSTICLLLYPINVSKMCLNHKILMKEYYLGNKKAANRNRTGDLNTTNVAHYRLCYSSLFIAVFCYVRKV